MASWGYSVGNVMSRAPAALVPVSPAAEDATMPLSTIGNGYADTRSALAWRADGTYAADKDVSLLDRTSDLAHAPNGCSDLLLELAGTQALSEDPCDVGTYEGRTAYRLYRPEMWDVDVMPGEGVRLDCGLWLPAASAATAVRVRVVDLETGDGWEGGSTDDWELDGVVASHAAASWLDLAVVITPRAELTERTRYRVILEPVAATHGPTTYAYVSDPALIPGIDLAAIVGHNLDVGATVTPVGGGDAIAVTALQPSCYGLGAGPVYSRAWRWTLTQSATYSPRPILSELWLGLYREMLAGGPALPFGPEERSHGLTLVGARGRRQVIPDEARPTSEWSLPFRARSTAHADQIRDEIARLTRHGAEPLLVMPSSKVEGGRVLHGRVGDGVAYQMISPSGADDFVVAFGLDFSESPFPGA